MLKKCDYLSTILIYLFDKRVKVDNKITSFKKLWQFIHGTMYRIKKHDGW